MQEKWESFGKKNWKNAKKDTSRKIGGRLVIGDIRRKKSEATRKERLG